MSPFDQQGIAKGLLIRLPRSVPLRLRRDYRDLGLGSLFDGERDLFLRKDLRETAQCSSLSLRLSCLKSSHENFGRLSVGLSGALGGASSQLPFAAEERNPSRTTCSGQQTKTLIVERRSARRRCSSEGNEAGLGSSQPRRRSPVLTAKVPSSHAPETPLSLSYDATFSPGKG